MITVPLGSKMMKLPFIMKRLNRLIFFLRHKSLKVNCESIFGQTRKTDLPFKITSYEVVWLYRSFVKNNPG